MHPFSQVSPPQTIGLLRRIRLCLGLVMAGLVLSGLLAFTPVRETRWLLTLLAQSANFGVGTPLFVWILRVHQALVATAQTAPFLAYSTDGFALAHLLLAVAFLGPVRQPVRNQWVITVGLICCIGAVLLAFVAGPIRGVPVFWRVIESSFAILCALPLLLCRHYVLLLEHLEVAERQRTRTVRQHRLRRKVRRSTP